MFHHEELARKLLFDISSQAGKAAHNADGCSIAGGGGSSKDEAHVAPMERQREVTGHSDSSSHLKK